MGTVDILGPRRGALVPEDSPAAFAHEMVRLLGDQDLRTHLASEGRIYAREWSDETLAGRMANLYRQIHAQRSAA